MMMASGNTTASPKWMHWVGWVLTVLPALMLLMSAGMKFMKPPEVTEGMAKFGWDEKPLLMLGIVELAATILFLIPQTAVLGAVLLTGYLGGAIATHVRIGDQYFIPVIMGVVIWAALWLRDSRIRALLPLRG